MFPDIPKNELWMIDIQKYLYDIISNYVPLLQKWLKKVIIRNLENVSKENRPFICINSYGWRTDSRWIRTEVYMYEVYAENIEQWESLRDILIDLFNRRNIRWIRSRLTNTWPNGVDEKTWLSRHLLFFEYVFIDSKF